MATVIGPRRASEPDGAPDDDGELDLPELEDGHWMHHATEFAHTSFAAVARRLPHLVREAVTLAWATSRRDTAAAIGLNPGRRGLEVPVHRRAEHPGRPARP
ncbi:hypothetical protein [Micromonospora mirobrigensis]|uniref:Uncharacterized protein n=1 Tax=Micromonospora mirobrigensis TaxID=262898 RepID=A0A1C4WP04_9ACTN|nr:hypothetical protein [Micromonospora mirobrigensis]SCE98016.1 hypothetical protein GA0070564_102414 [Micromonospora mirobrigensis]